MPVPARRPTALRRPSSSGTLTVFAAASLTETFDALADEFERQHPSSMSSSTTAAARRSRSRSSPGRPADVFAAASEATMQTVVDEDLAADPVVFATNTLELVVPAGNPGGVTGLADLASPSSPSRCATRWSRAVRPPRSCSPRPGSRPPPTRSRRTSRPCVTKVRLGEADAGLVYVTDVRAAGAEVEGIEVPEADGAVNLYPVAPLAGRTEPAARRGVDRAAHRTRRPGGPDRSRLRCALIVSARHSPVVVVLAADRARAAGAAAGRAADPRTVGRHGALLTSPAVGQALVLSVVTATIATGALPRARHPARDPARPRRSTGRVLPRRLLRVAVTIPLVLPPVIGGIALLMLLGRRGVIG